MKCCGTLDSPKNLFWEFWFHREAHIERNCLDHIEEMGFSFAFLVRSHQKTGVWWTTAIRPSSTLALVQYEKSSWWFLIRHLCDDCTVSWFKVMSLSTYSIYRCIMCVCFFFVRVTFWLKFIMKTYYSCLKYRAKNPAQQRKNIYIINSNMMKKFSQNNRSWGTWPIPSWLRNILKCQVNSKAGYFKGH